MIVVDTSVLIPYFHGHVTVEVERLTAVPRLRDVLIGDLVMLELLRGVRSNEIAASIERELTKFELRSIANTRIAIKAAANYRTLRSLGITIRSSIDVLIATFCIEGSHRLLHSDRDFVHFERHLGLQAYTG